MRRRWMLILNALLLASGCVYHVQERVDQVSCALATHPFDIAPELPVVKATTQTRPSGAEPTGGQPSAAGAIDIQTTSYFQQGPASRGSLPQSQPANRLKIPGEIPGSETAPIVLAPSSSRAARKTEIDKLYPGLPPLPVEPQPLPGPDGHPYTLASFQQIAAQYSPTLKQAVADVEAARGNLIQARAYPNPTVGYEVDPSNDGSTAAVQGFFVDQQIKTGGKLKLQEAAAQKDLENAELALRKARNDLATQVRTEYFQLLVAKETIRVTRALARFTDEVYRLQVDLLVGGQISPYEPAALRAQAYTARLASKQAISTYLYQWKQLTAVTGLRQLPLSEVSGRIDAAIPFYDYDAVLGHVLHQHTDVQTARNAIEKYRYNLKLAQVTPVPDVDVRAAVLKEYALPPMQFVHSVQVGVPIPVWDHNKGNIMAAEAALMRASEEPHRVETVLTNNLANAYTNYKNNLDALEYYRSFILPDQIRAFRGINDRRQGGEPVSYADLVTAQQTLVTSVQSYLGILGQIWTSVVGVADLLQTDDLFQLAEPKMLPPLPDLESLPPLSCSHGCVTEAGAPGCSTCGANATPAQPVSGSMVATSYRPALGADSKATMAGSDYIPPPAVISPGESLTRNSGGTQVAPPPGASATALPRLGFSSSPSGPAGAGLN
jgi:cobalt-zinc-cadmium efflux system outer membrane protein